MKLETSCGKCGNRNVIDYGPQHVGRRVRFSCQNQTCGETIRVLIPEIELTPDEIKTGIDNELSKRILSAVLVVQKNNKTKEQQFELGIGNFVIGRKSQAKHPDIAIESLDYSLSRLHCIINSYKDYFGSVAYILKDYNSKNGVWLNKEKVELEEEIYLVDGDMIKLGITEIIFNVVYQE